MGKYQPPAGYQPDPRTGMYFMQQTGKDTAGNTVLTTSWFDPETGQFTQTSGITKPARSSKGLMIAMIMLGVVVVLAVGIVVGYFVFADQDGGRRSSRDRDLTAEEEEDEDEESSRRRGSSEDDSKPGDAEAEASAEAQTPDAPAAAAVTETTAPAGNTQSTGNHTQTATTTAATTGHRPGESQPADSRPDETSAGTGTTTSAGGNGSQQSGYSTAYIYGTFECSSDQFAPPVLILYENKTFELTLNFTEGMNTYYGSYTVSAKQSEMDDVYVYLTIDHPNNGIPGTATVCFSDSSDYCMFLDEGFGLMGYDGAPYYFWRQ